MDPPTTQLTSDQSSTYSQLLEFGFTSSQATHASLRYGSNVQGALNWIMDNPEFDFNQTPTVTAVNDYRPTTPQEEEELPALVTADGKVQEEEQEEDLLHPDIAFNRGGGPPPPPPPPGYEESLYGPKEYYHQNENEKEKVLNLPSIQQSPSNRTVDIDLTNLDDQTPTTCRSSEITDLQKAIQLSTANNVHNSISQVAGVEEDEDEEISKALALSMVSLNSADLNNNDPSSTFETNDLSKGEQDFERLLIDQLSSIPSKDRIRGVSNGDSPEVAVILRSLSPHMSSLSSYLQCLYNCKTWRQTILAWREPTTLSSSEEEKEEEEDFDALWKGEISKKFKEEEMMKDHDDTRVEGEEAVRLRESILRIKSVQRLFSLMLQTRRKFLHVQEIVSAFKLKDFQFHQLSGIETIRRIHSTLISDLKLTTSIDIDSLFILRGKRISSSSEDSREEEAEGDSSNLVSTDCLDLPLNPASNSKKPETFFERLDNVLLENTTSTTGESQVEEEFHLLIEPTPQTLLISLNRQTDLTCLPDTFGTSTTSNSTSTGTSVERNLFKIEKEFWLDRYHINRKKEIKESRDRLKSMEKELSRVQGEVERLGTTKDGKNILEVLKGILDYFESRLEEEGETPSLMGGEKKESVVGGDGESEKKKENEEESLKEKENRKLRQHRLKDNYKAIFETLSTKLQQHSTETSKLQESIDGLFSSKEDWKTLSGPFKLNSYLFRTGLNGRGSTYSITFSSISKKWYKIRDLQVTEVEDLEKEFEDRTGLFLDGGIQLVFYELMNEQELMQVDEGEREEDKLIPENIKRGILRDNHSFVQELLQAQTYSEEEEENLLPLIESWNLPLQPQPQVEEAIPIISPPTLEGTTEEEIVQDINLSPSPSSSSKLVETPMSLDLEQQQQEQQDEDEELEPLIPPPPNGEEEVLRLRGGANSDSEEEEEEDYSDDDDEEYDDEDEVELGLLVPMPSASSEEEWDIDFKVGKIGGKPVWLDPRSPLKKRDVTCEVCGQVMKLLCQVNSPDDSKEWAAARSLYVFACRSSTNCLSKDSNKALKVWRTQMPSPNEFFPHTPETIKKRKQLELELDSETGLAKEEDDSSTTTTTSEKSTTRACWPEWDIAAEPEPYQESYLPDDDSTTPKPEQGEGGGEDADAPDTISGVDKEFLAFQERIEREPRQVLRFYRLPDVENPQPLWTSSNKIDSLTQVPPCELCRGPREVEFQILSTLLSHLGDDQLDFDSLLVYTCLDNCKIPTSTSNGEEKTGWAKEVIFKQDFTSSGVKFGFR